MIPAREIGFCKDIDLLKDGWKKARFDSDWEQENHRILKLQSSICSINVNNISKLGLKLALFLGSAGLQSKWCAKLERGDSIADEVKVEIEEDFKGLRNIYEDIKDVINIEGLWELSHGEESPAYAKDLLGISLINRGLSEVLPHFYHLLTSGILCDIENYDPYNIGSVLYDLGAKGGGIWRLDPMKNLQSEDKLPALLRKIDTIEKEAEVVNRCSMMHIVAIDCDFNLAKTLKKSPQNFEPETCLDNNTAIDFAEQIGCDDEFMEGFTALFESHQTHDA